jgi:acetate kinase
VHRIRKYLGSYLLQLGGETHAIVFSAGIGENSAFVRQAVCEGLERWGIEIDREKNAAVQGVEARISSKSSSVDVLVVPTDEELSIARDTAALAHLMG